MTTQCSCGCNPPHSDPAMCSRNHAATKSYMDSLRGTGAVGGSQNMPAEGDPVTEPRLGTISLAYDHREGDEFAAWLQSRGYDATVGRDDCNHVDGVRTDRNAVIQTVLNDLWDQYCLSE